MPTKDEIDRLAAAVHAVRPDWPTRSLVTYIAREQRDRPYRDLLIALTAVAADPTTKTPARVAEAGPWWTAAQIAFAGVTVPHVGPGRHRCPVDSHDQFAASNCQGCRSEFLASGTWPAGTRHHAAPAPSTEPYDDVKLRQAGDDS